MLIIFCVSSRDNLVLTLLVGSFSKLSFFPSINGYGFVASDACFLDFNFSLNVYRMNKVFFRILFSQRIVRRWCNFFY